MSEWPDVAIRCESCREKIEQRATLPPAYLCDPWPERRYWCDLECFQLALDGCITAWSRLGFVSDVFREFEVQRSRGVLGTSDEQANVSEQLLSEIVDAAKDLKRSRSGEWWKPAPRVGQRYAGRDRFDEKNPGGESSDGRYR